MADEQNTPPDGARGEESTKVAKRSLLKRMIDLDKLMSRKILGTLLVLSMLGHVAYIVIEPPEKQGDQATSREVTLGEFSFTNNNNNPDEAIRRVEFHLHVDLLAGTDVVARRRLEQRHSMVKQNVEQLLRRARAVDFTDPILAELKRQLQEAINETISLRGIADVIITDLVIDRSGDEKAKAAVATHNSQTETKESPNG